MENPFLQLKRLNAKLKLIIVLLLLSTIGVWYFTSDFLEAKYSYYIQENKQLSKDKLNHQEELKKAQEELKNKELELKKFKVSQSIISDYITKENSSLTKKVADNYASKIILESNKRNISPYVQTALLSSESSFLSNPKHDIKTVYGMGGIYANVWSTTLIKEGIIKSNKDLINPYKNIEASAFVVSFYDNKSKNIKEALSKYKGYCSLGKSQASNVMAVATKLKEKERQYNV